MSFLRGLLSGLSENCSYTNRQHTRRLCVDSCQRTQDQVYTGGGGGYYWYPVAGAELYGVTPCDYSPEAQHQSEVAAAFPDMDTGLMPNGLHPDGFNPAAGFAPGSQASPKQPKPPPGYENCILYSQRRGVPVYQCDDPKKPGRRKKIRGTLSGLHDLSDLGRSCVRGGDGSFILME